MDGRRAAARLRGPRPNGDRRSSARPRPWVTSSAAMPCSARSIAAAGTQSPGRRRQDPDQRFGPQPGRPADGRGGLYLLLQNRIYREEIERGAGIRVKSPSLLGGLLFDSEGQRMTPTHAVKSSKRYRYYVSRPLIVGARADASAGLRLPAAELRADRHRPIRRLLAQPASLFEMLDPPPVWWTPMLGFRARRTVSDECDAPDISRRVQARGG